MSTADRFYVFKIYILFDIRRVATLCSKAHSKPPPPPPPHPPHSCFILLQLQIKIPKIKLEEFGITYGL